ncbi:rhodanese-like domain-containing protein [Haloarcula marina]|uniref:rhodanese-like domain-containing protein n=1 Tax=Haloarcula marina TaxID=2961574 RepID=UPI0020B70B96|nr:rhodanese-like domain-containing protein [Halomicroarcula marina]
MDGEIESEELRSLLEADEARVVDIRSPAAFRRGHIPGSENVPFPSIVENVERFADADRIVTVCPHGKSSVQAARLIASYEGFDGQVESFEPGLSGWDGELADGEPETMTADEGPDAPF